MRWTGLGLSIGFTCAGVACVAGLLIGAYRVTVQPHTYREAVMQVLDQRDIPFADVQVSDSCPPSAQCWGQRYGSWYNADPHYIAEIIVAGVQPGYGQIVCQHPQHGCVLTLADLTLHHVPLRPLAQDLPCPEALKRPMQAMDAWLRTCTAHLRHP